MEENKERATVTKLIPGQLDLLEEVVLSFPDAGRVLDIGTGAGHAARSFQKAGWDVTATGFNTEAYLDEPLPEEIKLVSNVDICDAHEFEDGCFDAIWCAHVLEHVSDTGRALAELRRLLSDDGWLFISVPPHKAAIVGGHVHTGWNLGQLMYVLADAGFGLAEGRFVRHKYNVFGMVQKGLGKLPEGMLRRANGDIEILVREGRFPKNFKAVQGFNGAMRGVNWTWKKPPEPTPPPAPSPEMAAESEPAKTAEPTGEKDTKQDVVSDPAPAAEATTSLNTPKDISSEDSK
ncbi:MAG: class I SAM-dependent methyltransferase [Maritimibacter sp.]